MFKVQATVVSNTKRNGPITIELDLGMRPEKHDLIPIGGIREAALVDKVYRPSSKAYVASILAITTDDLYLRIFSEQKAA